MQLGRAWLAAAVVSLSASAGPSETTRLEIDHLFNYLKSSGCKFHRNGKWHTAEAASDHLRTKYDYLLKRDMVASTEAFIERAAAGSSMSSKPYQVRCANDPPVQSAAWLNAELSRYRAKSGGR
jgi:hypothetical protein